MACALGPVPQGLRRLRKETRRSTYSLDMVSLLLSSLQTFIGETRVFYCGPFFTLRRIPPLA